MPPFVNMAWQLILIVDLDSRPWIVREFAEQIIAVRNALESVGAEQRTPSRPLMVYRMGRRVNDIIQVVEGACCSSHHGDGQNGPA
jgi:hypothetical protein